MTSTVGERASGRSSQSAVGETFLSRLVSNKWLHLACLVAVVCLVFGRTLSSYFLADDIGEIKYVNQILSGRLDMLWSNFTGNYMQIPSMNVYRPFLLLTLLFDCAIWHGNAFGYYLTNLLYFAGDVVLVYTITRMLTNEWSKARSSACAFASGLLFALNPLHCESISWMVGRVDAACCFYYLASFICFVQSTRMPSVSKLIPWLRIIGTVSFWLAITTKEMAIGLPVMVAAYSLLWNQKTRWREFITVDSFKSALALSWPLWVSMAAYFVIRVLALGTILGGYSGSIGASQTANAISRWLDADSWHRLFFPLAQDIYNSSSIYGSLLLIAYAGLLGAAAVRMAAGIINWRWLCLLAVWIGTALAPIYRLWGLGFNLEGARFCFFFTVPLSILAAIVILARDDQNKLPRALSWKVTSVGVAALLLIAAVFSKAAYATNLLWVHAGKEVKSVLEQAQTLVASAPAEKKIIVLGLPKEHGGAHMILNGDTFKMLLGAPFVQSKEPLWARFITFEPVVFSPQPQMNVHRFKSVTADESNHGPFVWSSASKTFIPCKLASAASEPSRIGGTAVPYTSGHGLFEYLLDGNPDRQTPSSTTLRSVILRGKDLKDGDGIRISGLNVNPLQFDFLQFETRLSPKGELPFSATWTGDSPVEAGVASVTVAAGNDEFVLVRLPLSRNWQWFTNSKINEIRLLLPALPSVEIKNVTLVSAESIVPQVNVAASQTENGVYSLNQKRLIADFDGSRLTECEALEVEITDTDCFFDNSSTPPLLRTVRLQGPSARLETELPREGFYQIRARAVTKKSDNSYTYCDPITVNLKS